MSGVRSKVEEVWRHGVFVVVIVIVDVVVVLSADELQYMLQQLQGVVRDPGPGVNGELLVVATNHQIIAIDWDVWAWPTADIIFEMAVWSSKPFLE